MTREHLVDKLQQLTQIVAPSGHEEPMIRFMTEEFRKIGFTANVDLLGNVIVSVGSGTEGGVVVSAHMDEIGVIITDIDDHGFLRVQRIGGVPERALVGRSIMLDGENGLIQGTVGIKAHHLTSQTEKYVVTPIDSLYVDIGASSRDEAQALGVFPGTVGTYAPVFWERGGRVFAKALDNRIQCLALLQLAQKLRQNPPKYPVALIASVQEEFNIRGIVPAVTRIKPKIHICLDIFPATDVPDLATYPGIRLGSGPVVGMYSFHGRGTLNGLLPHPKLVQRVIQVARNLGIDLQRGTFFGGLLESSYTQVLADGVAAVDVCIPVRFTHAPIESASLMDVELEVNLLAHLLASGLDDLDLTRF